MDEVRHDFCVRLGRKRVPIALQLSPQRFVVFNNAIVNNRYSIAGNMGVGICCGWFSVRCPACVGDAYRSFGRLLITAGFQLSDFTYLTNSDQSLALR